MAQDMRGFKELVQRLWVERANAGEDLPPGDGDPGAVARDVDGNRLWPGNAVEVFVPAQEGTAGHPTTIIARVQRIVEDEEDGMTLELDLSHLQRHCSRVSLRKTPVLHVPKRHGLSQPLQAGPISPEDILSARGDQLKEIIGSVVEEPEECSVMVLHFPKDRRKREQVFIADHLSPADNDHHQVLLTLLKHAVPRRVTLGQRSHAAEFLAFVCGIQASAAPGSEALRALTEWAEHHCLFADCPWPQREQAHWFERLRGSLQPPARGTVCRAPLAVIRTLLGKHEPETG